MQNEKTLQLLIHNILRRFPLERSEWMIEAEIVFAKQCCFDWIFFLTEPNGYMFM